MVDSVRLKNAEASSDNDLRTQGLVSCPFPWAAAMIYPDGHVQTCCFNSTDLGNVNEAEFGAVWNGPGFRDLRRRVAEGDYVGAGCDQCPLYVRAGYTTEMAVYSKLQFSDGTEAQLDNARTGLREFEAGAQRMEAAPVSLALELSQACNYDCMFCFQEDKLLGIKGERVRGMVTDVLPKVRELVMTGGEPLAIKENLNILGAMTPQQRASVALEFYTNGALLDRHFDLLKTFSRINFVVSLHSLDDAVYRRIMVTQTPVAHVVSNIDACMEMRGEGADWTMVVSNLLLQSNIGEVEDLTDFALSRGIDLQFMHMHGDYEENIYLFPWLLEDRDGVIGCLESASRRLADAGEMYQRAVQNLAFIRRKLTAEPLPTLRAFRRWEAKEGRAWATNQCLELFNQR